MKYLIALISYGVTFLQLGNAISGLLIFGVIFGVGGGI